MICGINTIMKAVSLDFSPWHDKTVKHAEDGWRVSFDESLLTQVQEYCIIRDWLVSNTIENWKLAGFTSITFTDHSDAMLCYVKFSAGVYE